ncbi:hypothetical protein K474DRAFT_1764937 [Panus rudis PR-1116 ss-1]|nr:hypothetical protein K474DRAFT_1764937 [Panus rudis PR-1116 ss-1]
MSFKTAVHKAERGALTLTKLSALRWGTKGLRHFPDEARGQILTYLGSQLSRQPDRRFAFAVGIYGYHARGYIGDPSGLAFSNQIKYKERPAELIKFFQRYQLLSDEQRGFDPSITSPSANENTQFNRALNTYVQLALEGPVREFPFMDPKELAGMRKYKVPVRDDKTKKTYYYIICKPLRYAISPFGLFLRMYPALRLDASAPCTSSKVPVSERPPVLDKLCLLGDMWRYSGGKAQVEIQIVEELNQLGVPHLAPVVFGGDVRMANCRTQKTIVHELAQKEYEQDPEGNKGFYCLDEQTHYRFVQELAYPLNSFRNARELVQVIRDAFEGEFPINNILALCEAFLRGKRIHRRVSDTSVMISATEYNDTKTSARGMLGDWSDSRVVTGGVDQGATKLARASSWQFASIESLQNPEKKHTIHDDCQSFFWLLLHAALHHCEHVGDVGEEVEMFDQRKEQRGPDGNPRFVGGKDKHWFISRDEEDVSFRFPCSPLQTLLARLRAYWKKYDLLRRNRKENANGFKREHDKLHRNPRILLAYFDTALDEKDWSHDAWYPDQHPQMAKGERETNVGKQRSTATFTSINSPWVVNPSNTTTLNAIPEEEEEKEEEEEEEEKEKEKEEKATSETKKSLAGPVQGLKVGGTTLRTNSVYCLRPDPPKTKKATATY